MTDYVLILDCPDVPGIVHAVSAFLVERDGNIVESQQFGDRLNERFFMRVGFETSEHAPGIEQLRADFAAVADRFAMTWHLWDARAPYRTQRESR